LYFGTIGDQGWTFTYNMARLRIHDVLSAEFPSVMFESEATQNVFFLSHDDHRTVVLGYLQQHGCNVLLANNEFLLRGDDDFYAAEYPNVSFVVLNDYRTQDHNFSNRLFVANDYTGGYYVAGAAAAAQAKACIAFFAAWDSEMDPTSAFAGFLLGVRRVNATIPVHVIAQQSWYYPDSDVILTEAFLMQQRCDVIARYSDPSFVDVQVSTHETTLSVGSHSNLQHYVGDTVLTAVYVDWSVSLLAILRHLIVNGTLDHSKVHFYGMSDRAILVAPPSPKARHSAIAAVAAAAQYVDAQRGNIVCGPVRLRRGGTVFPANSVSCKLPWHNLADFITDDHVVHHAAFVDRATCGAGSYYAYEFQPTLVLVCRPCPANTLSTAAGSASCLPCPSGSSSAPGSQLCMTNPALSAGGVVGVCLSGFVLALLISFAYVRISSAKRRHDCAPRAPPLCFLFTEIEGYAGVSQVCPTEMQLAIEEYQSIVRSVVQRNGAYEVRQVEDSFMIVTKSTFEAVAVAVEIQEQVFLATLPPKIKELGGLRPRIGVHYCEDVEVFFDFREGHYDYQGPDADVAAGVASCATGGLIVATQSTIDALVADEDYSLVLAYEVSIRPWRDQEPVPGALSPLSLLSISSKHLERLHQEEFPSPNGPVERLPGMDIDLDPFIRSSISSGAPSLQCNASGKQAELSAATVALVVHHVLVRSQKCAPDITPKVLTMLSDAFGLEPPNRRSARRVAAGIATRLFPGGGPPHDSTSDESSSHGAPAASAGVPAANPFKMPSKKSDDQTVNTPLEGSELPNGLHWMLPKSEADMSEAPPLDMLSPAERSGDRGNGTFSSM
jgi:basic membrane lipoprotein Med (substrate-binding protein (PBP1-ABC) superfamily)/class 3 adenylate cyclase